VLRVFLGEGCLLRQFRYLEPPLLPTYLDAHLIRPYSFDRDALVQTWGFIIAHPRTSTTVYLSLSLATEDGGYVCSWAVESGGFLVRGELADEFTYELLRWVESEDCPFEPFSGSQHRNVPIENNDVAPPPPPVEIPPEVAPSIWDRLRDD
jgi:hypothetical protein